MEIARQVDYEHKEDEIPKPAGEVPKPADEILEVGERDEVEPEGMTIEEPQLLQDSAGDAALAMLEEEQLKKDLDDLNLQIKVEKNIRREQSFWEDEEKIKINDQKLEGNVKLISKYQDMFELSRINTSLSRYINNSDQSQFLVPTDRNILEIIVNYLNHHKGITPKTILRPVRSLNIKDICYDRWDALLVEKIPPPLLVKIVVCAEYLGIDSLIDLVSAMLAIHIKGKKATEIMRLCGVKAEEQPQQIYL